MGLGQPDSVVQRISPLFPKGNHVIGNSGNLAGRRAVVPRCDSRRRAPFCSRVAVEWEGANRRAFGPLVDTRAAWLRASATPVGVTEAGDSRVLTVPIQVRRSFAPPRIEDHELATRLIVVGLVTAAPPQFVERTCAPPPCQRQTCVVRMRPCEPATAFHGYTDAPRTVSQENRQLDRLPPASAPVARAGI
jgi:hypothetical protein